MTILEIMLEITNRIARTGKNMPVADLLVDLRDAAFAEGYKAGRQDEKERYNLSREIKEEAKELSDMIIARAYKND